MVAATSCIGPLFAANAARHEPDGRMRRANPCVSGTRISFALDNSSPVSVDIFTAQGKFAGQAANGTFAAGRHSVRWDRRSAAGGPVAGGVYPARVRSTENEATGRLALTPAMGR